MGKSMKEEVLKVVMGFLDKSYISYVIPSHCLNAYMNRVPQKLRSLLGKPTILSETVVERGCVPHTGLALHGVTPTGERGTYIEVYRGYLPPLPSFTPAQCVISPDGNIVGCRYLLQKRYVDASCVEQDLPNQVSEDELREYVMRVFRSLDSEGLWLYVIDCEKKLTLVRALEKKIIQY